MKDLSFSDLVSLRKFTVDRIIFKNDLNRSGYPHPLEKLQAERVEIKKLESLREILDDEIEKRFQDFKSKYFPQ